MADVTISELAGGCFCGQTVVADQHKVTPHQGR